MTMQTAYPDIKEALEVALTGVSGIPAMIKFENVGVEPITQTPWARTTFAPSYTEQATVGNPGKTKIGGLFLVDLFYPKNQGSAAGLTMAGAIIASFMRGQDLTANGQKVHCLKAQLSKAQEEPAWWQIPVSITWYAFIN